ncbi:MULTISPECIES: bifunctional tetrahydrofolate synthase/dihydrofolate synthase [unclassified Janthinobacterium]|uniref:bifunctional tetrahydrofolate synthase/dihydrofolate synthase n=1 Tax=unclassified Janthinobacterium TaxID=2610881 RepID=UPI001609C307|nr:MULTISPECIES: bifunctional tetrahydrofolate synthase/dihydrofolate synthase [unclassified Janthinobacterium]MBB5367283.1 dihydrofolate synthase/folylpolyglutamate synthase [Janthinobacterium sp. K2C7]MBB5380239.1 dihydrofolate synthase/folylpolyglutamate synthase [Janthinobacterium sp. K2Li3]MBB5385665.1 dihydrofolate synthase/folylpolyglutamate synthase [Janthinobacterium sp. K2E3]
MQNLPTTLPAWLTMLETRHSETVINMGLERVLEIKQRLALAFSCPVIMVAGTNGKGSTCAMLESVLLRAGYKVGLYIKPHFLDFNERARIGGEMATDEQLIASFNAVEAVRGDIPLTYFEFTTLAIMHLLAEAGQDVVILEVGLGGRLDAVNIVDADVSIVTSVDIDHTEFLGDTREAIGFEKAGIFRPGKAAICSDPVPPQSLIDHAEAIGADLWLMGRDFNYAGDKQQWNYGGREQRRNSLAYPSLRGANQILNACAVLAALEVLKLQLPVGAQEVRTGLVTVELPGRFQVLPGRPSVILDVAHNPHAASALNQNLGNMGFHPYTYAVFGSMHDKDIDGVLAAMSEHVDHWCLTGLPSPRAATASELAAKVQILLEDKPDSSEHTVSIFDEPAQAFANAMSRAGENDRIVVFGSFLTVAGVMKARKSSLH